MAEPDDQIERVCKQVYRPDAKVQFAFDFRIKLVEVPYDVGHENYGQTGWHRYPEAALGLLGYFEQLFVGRYAPRRRYFGSVRNKPPRLRSEEHTSELQSLMRSSYAVFCLKK